MRTTQITLLLGAVLLLCTCKKTEYSNTSTSTQPVFYFNGTINGSPVNIQAGVNNYYMTTSYSQDANSVYTYIGEFTTTGNPSTYPNSLEIFFKDNQQGTSSYSKHIDTVITPGYFSFSNPLGMASAYSVQFQDFFNQTATSYNWNYGDGQSGTGNKPIHTYLRPGIYTISLVSNSASCSSTDTNDAPVGQVGNAFMAGFSYSSFANLQTTFTAVPTGVPPYTYTWNFGDPLSSHNTYTNTSAVDSGTHAFSSQGVYYVSVTTTDATGYTDKQGINVATPSSTGCATGFYAGTQTPVANPKNLNDAGIKWYDNTGTLWTSENNRQSMKSMFHVTSIADYQANASGQATKIIGAKISCMLYNASNDSINFTGNVVFAIAHF